jgi:hypothetical protein
MAMEREAERLRDLIRRISRGMKVLDAKGEEIGKVDQLQMGDPEGVTEEPDLYKRKMEGPLLTRVVDQYRPTGDIDAPPSARAHLLRMGYIRIDGKGWLDVDRYASADQIESVDEHHVRLKVPKEALVRK